jgi:hypothetical protein
MPSKPKTNTEYGEALGAVTTKSPKQKEVVRKTTKEHLSDFAGKPGKKIGERGFLVG